LSKTTTQQHRPAILLKSATVFNIKFQDECIVLALIYCINVFVLLHGLVTSVLHPFTYHSACSRIWIQYIQLCH